MNQQFQSKRATDLQKQLNAGTTANNSTAYKLLDDTNRRIWYDGSVCAMCRDCF